MNKRELDYFISNGQFAVDYLQHLSETLQGKSECNKAFNHGSSVAQVVRMAELFYNQNVRLITENEELKKTIQDLKQGEFNELLKEEKEKLQKEFESLRNALTQVILDFPDIDY